MELSGYFAIVRRWWWTLFVAVWVAALGGAAVASQLPKVYQAEVQFLVGPINTDLNTQRAAGQLAQTYAQLVTSEAIVESVAKELGIDPAPLDDNVSASPNDVTRLVSVRVRGNDARQTAELANALVQELGEVASGTSGLSRPEGEIQVIDFAQTPTNAIAPQVSLIIFMAAAAGLLGAIVLVVLIEFVTDAVRSPRELAELTGAPFLAGVPTLTGNGNELAAAVPGGKASADYQLLTAKIELAMGDAPLRTLMVVGVHPADGANLVAANIALGLAGRGRRTALVDGNSVQREATEVLGLAGEPGLADHVAGRGVTRHRIEVAPDLDLTVIPGGQGSEVTRVDQVSELLEGLLESVDTVVVAAPPVEGSPATLFWGRGVDAVLLVAPRDVARRREVESTLDSLRLAGANLIGAVQSQPRRLRRLPVRRAVRVPEDALDRRSDEGGRVYPPARRPSRAVRTRADLES